MVLKTWDDKFELAKKYYEHYGNLKIRGFFYTKNGIDKDPDGFALGKWIRAQRSQYKLGELTLEHKQKLESIGMIFENVNDLDWNEFYNLLVNYYNKYGNMAVPKGFKTKNGIDRDESGKDLGSWLAVQRMQYKDGTLLLERKQKIDNLGNIFEKYDDVEWERMYGLVKTYYENNGNLELPDEFKTNDGCNYSKTGKDLSAWIRSQRSKFKKGLLSEDRIKKLEQIGMIFENVIEYKWEKMFDLAQIYYNHYKNLNVHRQFKTLNGYEYDENGYNLGKWLNGQYIMNSNGKLSQEKYARLESIGMIFYNRKEKNWNEMYDLAQKYFNYHHNLDVRTIFKTINGYEYDENGKPLGIWLDRQRIQYRKGVLNKEHALRLEQLGIVFDKFYYADWEEMYRLAETYSMHYGNLDVPKKFKTKNGIDRDESGKDLNAWLYRQLSNYRANLLSEDKKIRLESIGMVFETIHDYNWNRMYNLAKQYYLHHYDLRVDKAFKTINGYEYDENGVNLGKWIISQRTSYKLGKLSLERIKKLQLIGMIFNVSKNKNLNQGVCVSYGIDYNEYKKEIDSIPYREFIAKANYLNENGMSFIIDNDLHPIFFTSSMNMLVRYGISLEQLVENYEKQSEKTKRKMKEIKMGV